MGPEWRWNTLIKILHFSGAKLQRLGKKIQWSVGQNHRARSSVFPQAGSLPPTAPKILQAVTIFIPSYYTSLSNEAEQSLIKEDQNGQESHGCWHPHAALSLCDGKSHFVCTESTEQPASTWMLRGVEATLNSSQATFKSQELMLAILSPLYLLEGEEVKD